MHAFETENFFRVPSDNRDLNYAKYLEQGIVQAKELDEFNSNNTEWLDVAQIKEKLLTTDYIREALGV